MKHIFLAALFVSAAALQTAVADATELCVSNAISGTKTPTAAQVTVTDCTFGPSTLLQPADTVTSLTISGGKIVNAAIVFSHETNPIDFTVGGVDFGADVTNERIANLNLYGAISEGSTITLSGNTFYSVDDAILFKDPLSSILFVATGATIALTNNKVNLWTGEGVVKRGVFFPYYAELRNTNVTLFNNEFNLFVNEGDFTSSFNAVHFEAYAAGSNITLVENDFTVTGSNSEGQCRAIHISRESVNALLKSKKGFKAAGEVDIGDITDEDARTNFGKAVYTIRDNKITNFDVPFYVSDADGADLSVFENEVESNATAMESSFSQAFAYFPVRVDIRRNSFTSLDAAYRASVALEFDEVPPKSSFRFDENEFTTMLPPASDSDSYAVFVYGFKVGSGATVSVRGNKVLPVGGEPYVWDPESANAETMFLVDPSEGVSDTQPAIVVCDNTFYGVKLDTDALLLKAVKTSASVEIPIAPASECGYNSATAASVKVGIVAVIASLVASLVLV